MKMDDLNGFTVADLKKYIENIPDDMPIYLDDTEDRMALLSMNVRTLDVDPYDCDDDRQVEALVLGIA